MIYYFTAHTINCVCHSIRSMFRVLGIYNFVQCLNFMSILESYLHFTTFCTLKKVFPIYKEYDDQKEISYRKVGICGICN